MAASLIFMYGGGLAISSAKEGKSGSIRIKKLIWPRKRASFHENPNSIHIELTFINP